MSKTVELKTKQVQLNGEEDRVGKTSRLDYQLGHKAFFHSSEKFLLLKNWL